ncbi:MAG: hypothetical protein ACTHM6_15465, partial [Tepidisphaeraceae bacterium]
ARKMDSLESKMIVRARKLTFREGKNGLRARKKVFREWKKVFRERKNFLRARKMSLILLRSRWIAAGVAPASVLSERVELGRFGARKDPQGRATVRESLARLHDAVQDARPQRPRDRGTIEQGSFRRAAARGCFGYSSVTQPSLALFTFLMYLYSVPRLAL